MNQLHYLLVAVCLLLCAGFAEADQIPNLTGKWVETEITCVPFSGEPNTTVMESDFWNITQQDTIITGTNAFTAADGKVVEEPVAGVISPDGASAMVVDKSGGTYIIYSTGEDTLTINYLNTGESKEEKGYAFALSEKLKREA